MTEKDGGHQTPTQSFLSPLPFSPAEGKQFNLKKQKNSCAKDGNDALCDAKPRAFPPSDIDKTSSSQEGADFIEMLSGWLSANEHSL